MYGDVRDGGRCRDTRGVTAPTVVFDLSSDFRVVPLEQNQLGPDGSVGNGNTDVAADYRALSVVFAAQLLGRIENRPTIGHFTVTIAPFEPVDPRTAALAIAHILIAKGPPDRAVKLVRLPCGPAVATEEFRELAAFRLGQSQVYVKPPGCPGLVVLTMATPTVCDLPRYTDELALVARSLRFT